jgi:RNA polymerase sigma-70 factor (ECF subfamily)
MSEALQPPETLRLLENRAWVRALARRLLADENDVDDVEQETWAAALRSGPDEPRALRSWLGVVAQRFALQRLRGRARRARREEDASSPERVDRTPAEVVAEADAHGHVVKAVLALEEPYRTTVLLRYFEGLSIADVARKMDAPLETTRTRLRRAHERLRAELADDDDRALALLLAPLGARRTANAAPASSATKTRARFIRAGALTAAGVAVLTFVAWRLTRNAADSVDSTENADAPRVDAARVAVDPPRDVRLSTANPSRADASRARHREDAAAAGAPAQAQEKSDAPPNAETDGWIAYDLADGKPLAGFALKVTTAAGESSVTTDAAGRIPVDRATVLDVAPTGIDAWTFARPKEGAVKDEPSLWFWREREVTGTVRLADSDIRLAPAAVRFTWTFCMPSVPNMTPIDGLRWLRRHGLDLNERSTSVRVDERGRLSGKATAIGVAMLVAEVDGFGPQALPLTWTGPDPCPLSFELSPTIPIVGRLLDAAGEPVVGEQVSVSASIVAASMDEVFRFQCGARGRHGSIAGGTRGHFVAVIFDTATTDVRGIFRCEMPAVGAGLVSVFRPGCLVCRRELGALTSGHGVDPFEMRVAKSDVRVVFRDGDSRLTSSAVTVQVADGDENGFPLATDAEGRTDAGWLQRGRWYRINANGKNVCFHWTGQAEIDLSTSPKDPPKDK